MKKIIYVLSFLIIVHCTLKIEDCAGQWIQQSVPVTGGTYNDMKFANANTGFIINWNYPVATLLRTTNAGYNWQTMNNWGMLKIFIVDSSCILTSGYNNGKGILYKTTNSGTTWDSLISSSTYGYNNLHFFNRDTGLISSSDSYDNQIWKTTDCGITLQIITQFGGSTSGKFFFLKEKVNGEYYGWYYYPGSSQIYQTTNSGLNWQSRPGFSENVNSIFFVNKDTGWATAYYIRNYIFYTTNGGNNWNSKYLINSYYYDIFFANPNKGWISGASNKIYVTTNGGSNWGYQNIQGAYSDKLFFLDSIIGWSVSDWNKISHTTNGGGPITSAIQNNSIVVKDYKLYQNFPNPFNSLTIIKYQITKIADVEIIVYDITGRYLQTLIEKRLNAGEYEVMFDGSSLSSGIYFYQLTINSPGREQSAIKKMILTK